METITLFQGGCKTQELFSPPFRSMLSKCSSSLLLSLSINSQNDLNYYISPSRGYPTNPDDLQIYLFHLFSLLRFPPQHHC